MKHLGVKVEPKQNKLQILNLQLIDNESLRKKSKKFESIFVENTGFEPVAF